MIVGLVSTYREGLLAAEAVRSLLACCDQVRVLDGPIGEPSGGGIETDWSVFRREQRVVVDHGACGSDAEKRTILLERTRRLPAPVWGVILDGDELLVNGQNLPSLIEHHELEAEANGQVSFGATLRLVEQDGSAGLIMARLLRLDLVERWLISSYHILLKTGMEVSRPNAYFLKAGEPDTDRVESSTGMQVRRPLQGEPHILHRSGLRPPQRNAERQSAAEGSALDQLAASVGLAGVRSEGTQDDRPAIWLPN